jgi:fumarylacetoacetate (FAA) hydrolase family protein
MVACVRGDDVYDLSSIAPTMSQLFERHDLVAMVRNAEQLPKLTTVAAALHHSYYGESEDTAPRFIAPCDLQALKASGVTFVSSMFERVIEEQARRPFEGRGRPQVNRRGDW